MRARGSWSGFVPGSVIPLRHDRFRSAKRESSKEARKESKAACFLHSAECQPRSTDAGSGSGRKLPWGSVAASECSVDRSPDGSQITYSTDPPWDTWVVPTLGGQARLMIPNASGLTWIDNQHILFPEIKSRVHMAVVTATEGRAEQRDVYVPPCEGGMAHRSYLSPDHKWVLIAGEMDSPFFGFHCRLVPFDGSSLGRVVGPPEQPTRLQILKGASPFSVNYLYQTDSRSGTCGGNKARYARMSKPRLPCGGTCSGGSDLGGEQTRRDSVGINRHEAVMAEIIRIRSSEPIRPQAMRGRS